jgi:anti-anti-sigma factor
VRTVWRGTSAVIVLEGELDFSAVALAYRELDLASEAETLVIDLRRLRFMDASGIHMLLVTWADCVARDRRLFIVRGPARVHRGLQALGLERQFVVIDHPDFATNAAAA